MQILIAILIVVLIVVFIFFAVFFYKLSKIVNKVEDVINVNRRSIDISILEVSRNLEETTKFLKTVNMKEREIRETMDNVETITNDVATITSAAAKTVEKSEEILTATTEAIHGFNKINKVFSKGDKHEKSK